MRFSRFLWSAVLALLFLFVPQRAQAQDIAQAYEFMPRSDAGAAFESALRQHAEWRAENGDPWSWNLYEVVQGKHLGMIIARSSGHSWSDLDAYHEGFGPRGGQHFGATVAPLIKHTSSEIAKTDTAHSRIPENMEGYELFSVTTYYLKPGHQQDFMEAFDRFHQAAMDAEWEGYYVLETSEYGSKGPKVYLVTFHQNWADFQEPTTTVMELLQNAYGEEETQALFEQFSGSWSHYDNMVVRHRPDLSIEGAEGAQ